MWDMKSTKNDNFVSQVASDRSRSALSCEKNIYFSLELIKMKQDFIAVEPPHCCGISQVTEFRNNFFKNNPRTGGD